MKLLAASVARKAFCTVATVFLVSGCAASSFFLKPNTSPETIESYRHGMRELAVSHGETTDITIGGLKNADNELVFYVGYLNKGSETLHVNPERITFFAANAEDDVRELTVFAAEEYLQRFRARQEQQFVMETVFNAVKTAGLFAASGFADVFLLSQGAVSLLADITNTQAIAEDVNRLLEGVRQTMLVQKALPPGDYIEGYLMVHYEEADRFVIHIPVGNEVHTVEFSPGEPAEAWLDETSAVTS